MFVVCLTAGDAASATGPFTGSFPHCHVGHRVATLAAPFSRRTRRFGPDPGQFAVRLRSPFPGGRRTLQPKDVFSGHEPDRTHAGGARLAINGSLSDLTEPSDSAAQNASAGVAPTDVVAIDGPSGAGKSTIARELAQRLGYAFLDTGAMYRAITWHFLERGTAPSECAQQPDQGHAQMRAALADAELGLQNGHMLLNGRDITAHLRTREVESQVSAVSALSFVRARMGDLQRAVAMQGPVVAEGRDMGSVVFPLARWKVFLDAAPSERARRRCQDFERQGRTVSEQDVLKEILVRDRLDSTRSDAPLKQANDAVYIDTTGLTVDVVIERLRKLVQESP